jgi:hypothetical protein
MPSPTIDSETTIAAITYFYDHGLVWNHMGDSQH